jgi:hypothetical protein
MPKQYTCSAPSPQDNPNLRSSADNTSIRRERARRKFQFLAAVKFSLSTDRGRKTCEDHKVSHRLVADLANEIVTGPYPSLVAYGSIYAGQKALGELLGVHERQIRRAVAALLALGLLRIERDRRGLQTNVMIPLLDGCPLFQEIDCTAHDRATASSGQGARTSSDERASVSSNLKGEEVQDSSPVAPSAAEAVESAPKEEEIKSGRGAVNGADRPSRGITPPDLPTLEKLETSASIVGATSGSAIDASFAELMRLYPHPAGQRQRSAYVPHALARWRTLSDAEKGEAARAAPTAPGNVWVGHWLDRGRESGNFEVVELQHAADRVWVPVGTPQWKAWEEYYRAKGRRPQTVHRHVGSELQTGWMFETEWPPVVKQAPSPEACDE